MPKANAAWLHNSLAGSAKMIQGICTRVYVSPTTTPEAKALAANIAEQAKKLATALKTRL